MQDKNNDNIIDEIEERLKQLEKEKEQIEKMYGFNENILEDLNFTIKNNTKKTKTNLNKYNYSNSQLPKLDVTKKEHKMNYKTPDSLQDSLKYEPNIKDLLDENDLEPNFTNLNSLKSNPSIPKREEISNYIDFLTDEYIKNYIY
jgi:hypothetical protein